MASLWETPDKKNKKPDFSELIYGGTKFSGENLKWLEGTLYFRNMTDDEVAQNQLLNLVTESTIPAFLVPAYNDLTCYAEESSNKRPCFR